MCWRSMGSLQDQPDRITQLFLNPFSSAIARAMEIQQDGLRHLSGGRLVNPLGILAILQREYQSDFALPVRAWIEHLGPTSAEST